MDIEIIGEKFASAEGDADVNHWLACELAHQAEQTGRPEWAWLLAKIAGKSDDQVRHRRNAWVMYLVVLSEIEKDIRPNISFSHFSQAYKYLTKTETSRLVEAIEQASEEGMSVRAFGAFLADLFGDDPESRFVARYGRFAKEIDYMLGMAETYGISKGARRAMKLLKGRL